MNKLTRNNIMAIRKLLRDTNYAVSEARNILEFWLADPEIFKDEDK